MTENYFETTSIQETVQHIDTRLGSRLERIELAEAIIGLFYTGARLSTGHAGVAFTPRTDIPEAVCCPRTAARMPDSGKLRGKKIREFLPYAWDSNVLKSALGIAIVNALSHYLGDELGLDGYGIIPDRDAIDEVDFTQAKAITLVGAFVPFIRQLKALGKDFVVLEKEPRALKADELKYFRPQADSKEVLAQSNVVILTGATIVNHTIDELLSFIPPTAQIVVAGPTASMIPTAFFRRGVNFLGGIRVFDPDKAMRILAEGGSGYHLFKEAAQKILLTPSKNLRRPAKPLQLN